MLSPKFVPKGLRSLFYRSLVSPIPDWCFLFDTLQIYCYLQLEIQPYRYCYIRCKLIFEQGLFLIFLRNFFPLIHVQELKTWTVSHPKLIIWEMYLMLNFRVMTDISNCVPVPNLILNKLCVLSTRITWLVKVMINLRALCSRIRIFPILSGHK